MTPNAFNDLLQDWTARQLSQRQKVTRTISLYDTDMVKVKALAAVFGLSEQEVVASIIHHGLFELESKIPYEQGSKVIRVEEGEDVYEDIGMMPRYIDKIRDITRGR